MPKTLTPARPRRRPRRDDAPAAPSTQAAEDRYAAWARLSAWPEVPPEVGLDRFEHLRAVLGVTQADLAGALSLHPRTLQRRRAEGAGLRGHEAEALVRIERLLGLAVHVFHSVAAGAAWFTGHVPLLGETPLTAVRTERGARGVEQVLGVVEFGFAA